MANKITKNYVIKRRKRKNLDGYSFESDNIKIDYQKLLNNKYKADVDVKIPDRLNVKIIEENSFFFWKLFIIIPVILLISLTFMYLFNYLAFNEVWLTKEFWNVFVYAFKDFLYSSLFVSIITFLIFIVFKRKI